MSLDSRKDTLNSLVDVLQTDFAIDELKIFKDSYLQGFQKLKEEADRMCAHIDRLDSGLIKLSEKIKTLIDPEKTEENKTFFDNNVAKHGYRTVKSVKISFRLIAEELALLVK